MSAPYKPAVSPEERERIRKIIKSAKPGEGTVFGGTLVVRLLDDLDALVRIREATLRDVHARILAAQTERCAYLRGPQDPLINGGQPYCAGYYERGLRCPECPEEDGTAIDILETMLKEIV